MNGIKTKKSTGSHKLDDFGDVLTAEELAEFLGIGLNLTYRCLRNGEIKSIKIGRKIIIPRHYIEDYLYSETTLNEKNGIKTRKK